MAVTTATAASPMAAQLASMGVSPFPLTTKLLRRITTEWADIGHATMTNRRMAYYGSNFLYNSDTHKASTRKDPRRAVALTSPLFSLTDSQALKEGVRKEEGLQRLGAGLFEGFIGDEGSKQVARSLATLLADHRPFHRLSSYDLQTHARIADGDFLMQSPPDIRERGCRGVWFVADHNRVTTTPEGADRDPSVAAANASAAAEAESVAWKKSRIPEFARRHSQPTTGLAGIATAHASPVCDVMVASVGDCRGFGVAREPPPAFPSPNKVVRVLPNHRVVPLTVDHRPLRPEERLRIEMAGGAVDLLSDSIDGNPFYNVSRAFGHYSMKCNPSLAPSAQKIVPEADVKSWTMGQDDLLILASHAVFETRGHEQSNVDHIAATALEVVEAGGSVEEAAAAICDFAIGFGATHNVSATVMRAGPAARPLQATIAEKVVPGTLYVGALQQVPSYRDAVLSDLDRLGLTLSEWLQLRWLAVKDAIVARRAMLRSAYGTGFPAEARMLAGVMQEEEEFFRGGPDGGDDLTIGGYALGDLALKQLTEFQHAERHRVWFDHLARTIIK